MRARFVRSHRATRSTIEGVIEEQRCYAEFFRLKLVEDVVCVVSTVEVADSGMVAPDNEVRATIIFTNQGVEDRFAWSSVAHRGRQDCKNRARRRAVVGQ